MAIPADVPVPRRIAVLGSPGSGKSAFCHRLAAAGPPLFHLDDLYWWPGWRRTPEPRWRALVQRLAAQPEWIIDGNYAPTAGFRLERADLVVLLDYHPLLCAWRTLRRSVRLRRGSAEEYLPRRLRATADPYVRDLKALLGKVLAFRRKDLASMRPVLSAAAGRVVVCRTPARAERVLAELTSAISASPRPGATAGPGLVPCDCVARPPKR
ncbi:hypothetical protein [Lentzea sp. NPDC092896]|uniref:hypothetical protein n=1 Tax=Lentzea sp. NPDC092896 TaxID=3364127 RepID=UPI00382B757C